MNKKGQGLPMNFIIIAIIAVVVLILIVTFFFGGFSTLTLKIKSIFYGTLPGTSESLAIQACDRYCSNLQFKADPGDAERQGMFDGSTFCKEKSIDLNDDGEIQEDEKDLNCEKLGVSCQFTTDAGEKVSVSCS